MVKSTISKAILFCQVLLLVAFCPAAWSAPPPVTDEITPGAVLKSLQPKPIQEPAKLPEIVIEEEGAPRLGDSGVKFQLKGVIFDENLIFSPEQLTAVIAGYIGKTIEVGKLTVIADAITSYYKQEGYFLTRAYLPPQAIKDGKVVIKVREGRLGDIIIKGNKRYSRDLIRNTMKIVRGEGAIRTDDVERSLLLLMDYPGLNVKATFKPGALPSTSDIVLEVTEDNYYKFTLDYDDFGSRYVSMNRVGATLDFYNAANHGDILTMRSVIGTEGPDSLFYGRLEYMYPLGYSGARMGINYTASQYKLGKDLAAIDGGGESKGGGIWLSYPLVRSRNFNWFLQGGFDVSNTYQIIFNERKFSDRTRYAYLGTTFQWVDVLEGSNTINIRGSQSFAKLFGGTNQSDTDTIRLNTDVIYSKLEGDVTRIQRLPYGFAMLLTGSGQWTGYRLPSGEQFHLGGAGSVRGYAQGERSGDSGVAATAEMRIPILGLQNLRWFGGGKKVGDTLQWAAFYDYGKIWISDDVQWGEQAINSIDMQGAGAGLRFTYSPYVRFKVDYAKSVGGITPVRQEDKEDGVWYIQAAISF
jgi:hemolysin activation/secretion protein